MFSSLRYLLSCINISGSFLYMFIFSLAAEQHVRHCQWSHVTLDLQQLKKREESKYHQYVKHHIENPKTSSRPRNTETLRRDWKLPLLHRHGRRETERKTQSQFKTGNIRLQKNQMFFGNDLCPSKQREDGWWADGREELPDISALTQPFNDLLSNIWRGNTRYQWNKNR